jgi:hypothetical protein
MNPYLRYSVFILFILFSVNAASQKIHFQLKNQICFWSALNHTDYTFYQVGARYIPALDIADTLKNGRLLDAELSVDGYGALMFTGDRSDSAAKDLQPYRFWLRYSGKRFELRLGLQKINFGSSSILRPLMWFDRLDFRDPLQFTNGVWGALGRYYFKNNVNIRTWILYGEKKVKGWELAPTWKGTPEYGGRIQIPAGKGEMGFSFHHREEDFSSFYHLVPHPGPVHYPENRIGIDGKWDLGPGLWYEYVLKHNDHENGILGEWETYFDAGIDYTFGVGNGLNMTTEYFRYNNKETWNGMHAAKTFSALAANYPFGILNRITAVVYYNWSDKELYRFINLERNYNLWSFYLMLFWNPERFYLYGISADRNLMAGKGFQIMAVVNF